MTPNAFADRQRTVNSPSGKTTVIDLATRRQNENVLSSISFVFAGVHYGTVPISAPYTKGKPIVLYILPQGDYAEGDIFVGPLDCLVTDDITLAADLDLAR